MTDRPILFSAPMVRALLNGTKTQTRRLLKIKPTGEVSDFIKVASDIKTGRSVYEMKDANGKYVSIPRGRFLVYPHYLPPIAIGDRLCLPASVKRADNAILADEAAQIMGPSPVQWTLPEKPLGVHIYGMYPKTAKQLFLSRFNVLHRISHEEC